MLCDRENCKKTARWIPALVLQPALIYSEGADAEAVIRLQVCDQHRRLPVSEFLNAEAWERIQKACADSGLAVPDASQIRLRFYPIPAQT